MVEDSNLQRRSYGGNRSPESGDKSTDLLTVAAFPRQPSTGFESLQANEAAPSEREMNDTTRRTTPRLRFFDGRIEKRLSMSVPVYLTAVTEPRSHELTTTENVSPHGARAISKRSWRSGEKVLIAPLPGEFPQVGRVVYCETRTGGRFRLGMEFSDRSVKWAEYARI